MLGTILNERLIREVEENVHNIVPRVAAIQDISGFGRCSLTVIMPILACMGAQVCPVPTAILSTHTGGFTNMTFTDLTDEMEAYINHWKEIGLGFDYIYTGFLGNEKQIDTVIDFCEGFKRTGKECIVVDPVMGDNGKLYKTYNVVMQEKMRDLVAKADIITPNLTEAMFLLKKEYEARAFSDDEIKETLAAGIIDLARVRKDSTVIDPFCGSGTFLIESAIKALNIWKKWTWDKKWTETEFEQASEWYYKMLLNLWNSLLPWENVTLFDKLQVLDQDASIQAALTIIKEETTNAEDRDVLDKFFETKEQEDWTKITTMKNSYKSILTQFGSMARALEDWNIDRFIAESSSIANQFMQDDPSGLVTTSLIDSIYQRVYNTDSLSPELKLEAMAALFHHNKDFIERNSEKLRETMWDDYDVIADYMNWIIYQWDGETISTLESLVSSWKSANSGSGKTWKALSSAFKETALKVWWSNYSRWNWWTSSSYKQFAPMQIKWASLVKELWVKWYSPNVAKLSFDSFKPTLDLSLKKDINRKVKTTKSQEVSNKKQLSKLEEKATKAIEAES